MYKYYAILFVNTGWHQTGASLIPSSWHGSPRFKHGHFVNLCFWKENLRKSNIVCRPVEESAPANNYQSYYQCVRRNFSHVASMSECASAYGLQVEYTRVHGAKFSWTNWHKKSQYGHRITGVFSMLCWHENALLWNVRHHFVCALSTHRLSSYRTKHFGIYSFKMKDTLKLLIFCISYTSLSLVRNFPIGNSDMCSSFVTELN